MSEVSPIEPRPLHERLKRTDLSFEEFKTHLRWFVTDQARSILGDDAEDKVARSLVHASGFQLTSFDREDWDHFASYVVDMGEIWRLPDLESEIMLQISVSAGAIREEAKDRYRIASEAVYEKLNEYFSIVYPDEPEG